MGAREAHLSRTYLIIFHILTVIGQKLSSGQLSTPCYQRDIVNFAKLGDQTYMRFISFILNNIVKQKRWSIVYLLSTRHTICCIQKCDCYRQPTVPVRIKGRVQINGTYIFYRNIQEELKGQNTFYDRFEHYIPSDTFHISE